MGDCYETPPILADDLRSASLKKVVDPDQSELVRELYELEQDTDGTPGLSITAAWRAHQALLLCVEGSGYAIDCLEEAVGDAEGNFFDPSDVEGYHVSSALAKINNPKFVKWVWDYLDNAPIFRQIIFSDPECLEILNKFHGLFETGHLKLNGEAGQYLSDAKKLFSKRVKDFAWNGWMNFTDCGTDESHHVPDMDIITTILARVCLRAKVEKAEYKMVYRPSLKAQQTRANFEFAAASDNAAANMKVLSVWWQFGFPFEDLKPFLWSTQTFSVFDIALPILLAYNDKKSTDMAMELATNGSFNMQQLAVDYAKLAIHNSRFEKRANALIQSDDPHGQEVGRRLLASIRSLPKGLNGDTKSVEKTLAGYNADIQERLRVGVHTTTFFRFPRQLQVITYELKQLVSKPRKKPVKVVIVGASYGPEPYSLMMYLDNDYRKNPDSWNGVHPFDQVEIVATDISEWALRYAERGRFVYHPTILLSDFYALEEFASMLGIDPGLYFDKLRSGSVYHVKKWLRERLKTAKLDILNPEPFIEEHGRPDIIVYNMVDGHLGTSKNAPIAARNVARLAKYAAFVTPRLPIHTGPTLEESMNLDSGTPPCFLFHSKTKGK